MSNEDTINLLKECNAGCKSATNSMEQVQPYVKNDGLKALINEYNDKHIKLGDVCHDMLNQMDENEKDPHPMAKAMSWISTEMKLMVNDDTHQVASLMVDGCNMGIKGLSRYVNQYPNASDESMDIAQKLIKTEQNFMNELLCYL